MENHKNKLSHLKPGSTTQIGRPKMCNLSKTALASTLKMYRKRLNLGVTQLAHNSNVPVQTIYSIEGQHFGTNVHSLYRICRGLNVDPGSFFGHYSETLRNLELEKGACECLK